MTLNYCYFFYFVALHRNITQAAKYLNISQPSVSRAIALLEEELGKPLFIRSKSGVTLTEDGEIFFEYVSKGMKWLQKAEREITDPLLMEETLTIGVSQLTIRTILPPILQKFSMQHPDVNMSIHTDSSIEIIKHLLEDLIDVAIIPDPIDHNPDLEIISLMDISSILIAGTKYSFLTDHTLTLDELNRYPFITLSQGTAGRRWLDSLCMKHSIDLTPSIEVPSSDLIVPLVKYNLGIGIVSDVLTKEELETGEVIKLTLLEKLPKRTFILCYRRSKKLSRTCEHFVKLIQESFSEEP